MVLGKKIVQHGRRQYLLLLPSKPCVEKGAQFVLEGCRDAKKVLFLRLRHTGLLGLRLEQRDPGPPAPSQVCSQEQAAVVSLGLAWRGPQEGHVFRIAGS